MEHPKYREILVSDLGDEYLQHAGVKGMKWGVHRSRSAKYKHGKLGSKRAKKRYDKRERRIKSLGEAYKRAHGARAENRAKVDAVVNAAKNNKKPVSEMTTQEMQDVINRHNVEVQYRKITEVPKKETAGQKATRYIAKKALKAGDAAVDRIMKDSVNSLISSAQKKLLEDQKKKKG